MALSAYDVTLAPMLRHLHNLSVILDKAVAQAGKDGIDLSSLLETRLAPDMYTLARQVQAASDAAKSGAARMAGQTPPSYPDTETTFPELQERIAKTIAFVESVGAAGVAGAEDRTITIPMRSGPVAMQGTAYMMNFAMPNFFFHVTAAYAILRHKGITIGKMDFLGSL